METTTARTFIKLDNPSLEDLAQAWEDLGKPHDKLTVRFSEPVRVRQNRRKVLTTESIKVRLWLAAGGKIAYTFHRATGYPFSSIQDEGGWPAWNKVISIENDKHGQRSASRKKLQSIHRRIHPNAWSDLREKIKADPDNYLRNYQIRTTNIKSRFPATVIGNLRDAFENRTDYRYSKPGRVRDLSVSTKLDSDGVFRAWFSSEYPGHGNGQYWLLINPTTAALPEWD